MQSTSGIELDGQYRTLGEAAGLLARDGRRLLAVAGPDAAEYLQGQLTNEVEALSPGEGCYAALLDRKGHMQADMRVLRDQESLLVDAEEAGGEALLRHLSMYRIGSDVSIDDVSAQEAVLSLIGPAASEIAVGGPLGPEHAHREVLAGGHACRAVATDAGVDLIVPAEQAEAVAEALRAGGAEPVSEAAAEILRVESGRPRFGREMTTATIPQEAGINERAVSFSKGCYIGQETVARLHYRGKPNRGLRGLRLAAPAAAGDPVRLGERELGAVGTAVLSPRHGPIALAILRREAEPGATVAVGDGIEAEVVELPF
jgi:folate-binding protein YgfZ